ncbi:Ppx/GppA phosphatase family protein [Methanobrevibacter sp.]|uniref:Ppx/GppA phosphatase family protein n=1 Tax=Methanobrevibacter sp. TaxID=66852 RepID=UPI002E764213|nr:hypothetical protein [Methanobrevibacter sp.]MEE0025760.1 hypothetical protein [Methanobrevibacter sp.]
MQSKKFIILLIFLLSILMISSVSAKDLNTTDSVMLTQGSNQNEILDSSYVNQSISSSDANASEAFSSSYSLQNDKPEGIYGIVDFGTNVLTLNIYDVNNNEITKILDISEPSVISNYTQDNILTPQGIEKLISQLENYSEIMRSNGVTNDYIFATSSLRNLDNRYEVVAAVKDRLGIYINVISVEKEAEFGFKAVREMDLTTDSGLLIDLGGGSCEIIYFINKTSITDDAMPFGSNSAYKQYVSGTFPNETERLEIKNRTLDELKKLAIKYSSYDDLFGNGGTVYTIKLMLISLGFIDENESFVPVSKLDELLDNIKDDTEENRQKIIDVAPGRLYTLIPGIIILKTILEYYNVKYLHFCSGQITDGVLYELLENESSKDKPVDPSSRNESSNSSCEKALASSKLISNPTGNPIAVLILVFFSIFVSCYKRKS